MHPSVGHRTQHHEPPKPIEILKSSAILSLISLKSWARAAVRRLVLPTAQLTQVGFNRIPPLPRNWPHGCPQVPERMTGFGTENAVWRGRLLTVAFNWRDIPVTAEYEPGYAEEAGVTFGRLDISAPCPLSISKQPARDHVTAAGGPEALGRAWLDESCPSKCRCSIDDSSFLSP